MTLVPQDEQLVGEVSIQNQDIGFVKEGQTVRVKLAAYPFTKYGMLEGTVARISADATDLQAPTATETSETRVAANDSPFKALIKLTRQDLSANGLNLPVAAGMRVSAEIRQGERTVMECLLSAVQRVSHSAATER